MISRVAVAAALLLSFSAVADAQTGFPILGSGLPGAGTLKSGSNSWGGIHNAVPPQALTDGATITPRSSFGNYTLIVTGSGHTIACPASVKAGDNATFLITEGSGSNLINFSSTCYKWFGKIPLSPTNATVSGVDYVGCQFDTSTTAVCGFGLSVGASASTSIWASGHISSGLALSGGNLIVTLATGDGSDHQAYSTPAVTSGKHYFQETPTSSVDITQMGVGVGTVGTSLGNYLGGDSTTLGYYADGAVYTNNAPASGSPIASYSTGVAVCVAIDIGNSKIWFQPIGSGQWDNNGTDNPDTNTGGFSTSGITNPVVGANLKSSGDHTNLNFTTPCAGVSGITTFSLMP